MSRIFKDLLSGDLFYEIVYMARIERYRENIRKAEDRLSIIMGLR